MKIKNMHFYKPAASTVLSLCLLAGSIGGSIAYYQYENISQVSETSIDNLNTFIGEDGKTYSYFDVGEHVITVSRNDTYTYKTEEIEGYTITGVEVNSWRDNSKITYKNTVPVIVEATTTSDGKYEFNSFGKTTTGEKEKHR